MECPRCKGKGKKIDIIKTDQTEDSKEVAVYQCTKCKAIYRTYENGHTVIMNEYVGLLMGRYLK
jgi:transcriptional regulator NrdR family protein